MAASYDSCFRVRYPKRAIYDEDELSVTGYYETVDLGIPSHTVAPESGGRPGNAEVAWCPLAARLRHIQTGRPVTLAGSPMTRQSAKVSALAALADDIRALDDTLSAPSSPETEKSLAVADHGAPEQGPESSRNGAPRDNGIEFENEIQYDM